MDPKIAQIMAKMNGDDANKLLEQDSGVRLPPENNKPPNTYEEFIKLEGLGEWPGRLTMENRLDLTEDKYRIGNPDYIFDMLRQGTALDLRSLDSLEERLEIFDETLYGMTGMILASVDDLDKGKEEHLPLSVNKGYLKNDPLSDALKTTPSCKKIAIKGRFHPIVDQCEFPGFRGGELTELPGSIEAPQILHRVTKAQDFKPGFRKFWKKIFQSEASIAMMQDSFWWIFLELFLRDKMTFARERSQLFDRLADNFVALFSSINYDVKDKVLAVFPGCLAQSLFVAFSEAFPKSGRYFDDMFKQYLCNICSEWMSGMKAVQGTFESWDLKLLKPKGQTSERHVAGEAAITFAYESGETMAVTSSTILVIEEFKQLLASLGHTMEERQRTELTMDKVAADEAKKMPESSAMGRGHEMERSLFDLLGKSPLVKHYLRMLRLHPVDSTTQVKVFRTEITPLPSKSQKTYRVFINDTKASSKALSTEYQKVCDMTNQELVRIARKSRDTNRKIERLQKELHFCKNSMEVKLMGERIVGKQDLDNAYLTVQDESDED